MHPDPQQTLKPCSTHMRVVRQVRRVAVLGLGNVAIDCARMLLQAPARLAATDVAGHALAQLARGAARSVDLIGRRGPVQVWPRIPIGCSVQVVAMLPRRCGVFSCESDKEEACVIAWAMEPTCLLTLCMFPIEHLALPLAISFKVAGQQ